nr:PAS domain S-box protein [uncultured Methylotenera sp.]
MKTPSIPYNEIDRLEFLKRLNILDSLPEQGFDDLTCLASEICQTPIAIITLLDETRQWFKSKVGLAATETPRDISFCGHAILGDDIFEIPNALDDDRFHDNPLVTGDPNIRFYAGIPLISSNKYALGTLCVIDRQARELSTEQREALKKLGNLVETLIDTRIQSQKLEAMSVALFDKTAFLSTLLSSADESIISTDLNGLITSFSRGSENMLGYKAEELIGLKTPAIFHDTNEMHQRANELSQTLNRQIDSGFYVFISQALQRKSETREWTYIRKDGTSLPVSLTVTPMYDNVGELFGYLGIAHDISQRKQAEQETSYMAGVLERTGELAKVGGWELDIASMQIKHWTTEVFRIHELVPPQLPSVEQAISFYPPDSQRELKATIDLAIKTGQPWDMELPLTTAKGNHIWVRTQGSAIMQGGEAVSLIGAFQDITAQKTIANALIAREKSFNDIIEYAPIGMAIVSLEGRFTRVNQALCNIVGYSNEELMQLTFQEITFPDDLEADLERLSQLIEDKLNTYQIEKRYIHKDKRIVWVQLSVSISRDVDRLPKYFIAQIEDITERKNLHEETQQFAYHDPLTNLPNRRMLLSRLHQSLLNSERFDRSMALLFLDLDHFKHINDSLGHDVGDLLLKEVANRLLKCVRAADTVSRQGGDEFVIILSEISHTHDAELVAQKIIESFKQPILANGHEMMISTSIGIAVAAHDHPMKADELMKQADKAMYEAKGAGRNRYCFHD